MLTRAAVWNAPVKVVRWAVGVTECSAASVPVLRLGKKNWMNREQNKKSNL